jgi:uncharacterized delta-60 repeat protein
MSRPSVGGPRATPARTSRVLAVLLLAASAFALAIALGAGAPGDLDRGFGADGMRRIQAFTSAEAVAVQPDGRIVVAGWNGDVAVARLSADGSDDPSFGGTRFVDFGSFDFGQALAVQPDGRIVVAGRSGGNMAIARLNPDGSPDLDFGAGGKRTIDHGGSDGAEAVAIQPDGRIVVAGFGGADRSFLVTLLHPNGADDAGFGAGGTARVDFGLGPEEARALALQPDGKIVVAGTTFDRVAIARLNPVDGSPDMGFGTAGKRVISSGVPDESAEALAIEPDGGIVVAGTASKQFLVRRLNGDGTDDLAFGPSGGGAVFVRFGLPPDRADAVTFQPDGKIVAAGSAANDLAIVRLQPSGLLDTTFGGFDADGNRTGKRTFRVGNFGSAANALAPREDGRIVLAGSGFGGPTSALVARLEGDPRAAVQAGGGAAPAGAATGAPPRCAGRPATIVGTPRRDVLRGTRRADVIEARGGDDVVLAGVGRDLVCGGSGRDRLLGQGGADRLLGQGGRDRLLGGPGADVLVGGAARDTCLGGSGRDRAACEMRRGL